ncbi:MAG: exopolysaccharide biosynthesis polyprenyl glycosylphosphotransferase [Lachnospiraceae bacterium]|nr:exopolysaccharide biosynthesis polyprenyl glycosylphosphotransferase [Lachnospiraceae bacterium]
MEKYKHELSVALIKFIYLCAVTAAFGAAWFVFYSRHLYVRGFYFWGDWCVIALYFVIFLVMARTYEATIISMVRISEMVYSQVLTLLVADGLIFVVICLLSRRLVNVLPLLLAAAAQIALSVVWSVISHKWYYAVFPPQKSAVIYDRREGMENLVREYGLDKKFRIAFTARVSDCLGDLSQLRGLDSVFLSGIRSHDRNIILKYCIAHDVEVYVIPRIGDVIMSGARQIHMFHLPMLRVGRYRPSFWYLFIKRVFDIAVSLVMLILTSPIFLATAIAIKAGDGGPVFYSQVRLTKNGRKFRILKFRSMRIDAEKDGVARLSTGDKDDRITPVGHVIRKCRIDELPQLINILKGEVSVVGPRPERPEIAARYEKTMPEFRLRLQAKCGLTGYAQVYGKYNTTPYDKLQMDLMYIAHPSFIEDLKICFATVKILFMADSTEGVAEGSTTAMDQPAVKAADKTGRK